jgi:hypothetical protein
MIQYWNNIITNLNLGGGVPSNSTGRKYKQKI